MAYDPSEITTSTGTRLAVSATLPATYNEAGFEALTLKDVEEAEVVPTFGAEATEVNFTAIKTGIQRTLGGSINYGSLEVTMALNDTDEGQAILETKGTAAAGASRQVACSVTLPNGTVRYFTAQVLSFKINADNADAITKSMAMLRIDNAIIKAA